MTADVIIIGGGVIGAAISYYLSLEKVRVLVLEKGAVGQKASQGAVGFLTIDSIPFAHDGLLRAALAGRRSYPALAAELEGRTGQGMNLEHCGSLRVARTEADLSCLEREVRWHKDHVSSDIETLSVAELRRRWPDVEGVIAGGYFYSHDLQITSSGVVEALRSAATGLGAVFVENAEMLSWQARGTSIGAVIAGGRPYEAATFVLAAGAWTAGLASQIGLEAPVYPVRGQLLIFETKERFLSCPMIVGGADESYYLGPKADGLYAGTTLEEVGFDESCTEEALERIGEETAQIAPRVRELPIKGSWAGLRPATRDNLPIIGKAPGWDNLFLAAGHFRKGVLLAPWTGQTLARLIMGRPSDIPIGDFSPSRFVAQIRKL